MMPIPVPAATPPISPRQVLPSPNRRFPFQLLPKSIGVPPPNSTAAEFGTYAGSISQKPSRMRSRNPHASMPASSVRLLLTFPRVVLEEVDQVVHRRLRLLHGH